MCLNLKKLFISLIMLTTLFGGCSTASRLNDRIMKQQISNLSSSKSVDQILFLASLAPSSHNTQPWLVKRADNKIELYADFSRWLNVTDYKARGLYISIGAYLENLEQAAQAQNFRINIDWSKELVDACDGNTIFSKNILVHVATISLKRYDDINIVSPSSASKIIDNITQRMTLRTPFDTLSVPKDIMVNSDGLCKDFIFEPKSAAGEYIAKNMVEAYTKQSFDSEAQKELEDWLRFSNRDVRKKRDGITTSGMGLKGMAALFVRNFMKPSAAKEVSFNNQGIAKCAEQVSNCGGWIVISVKEETPLSWIEVGRVYERINLKCRDYMVGMHPMNQIVEVADYEGKFAKEMAKYVGDSVASSFPYPAFVARVGITKKYPQPVSLRR